MTKVLIIRLGPAHQRNEQRQLAGSPEAGQVTRAPTLLGPSGMGRATKRRDVKRVVLTTPHPEFQIGFGLFAIWLALARPRTVTTMTHDGVSRIESLGRFLLRTAPRAAQQILGAPLSLARHAPRVVIATRRIRPREIPVAADSLLYARVVAGNRPSSGGSVTHMQEVIKALQTIGLDVRTTEATINPDASHRRIPDGVPPHARLLPALVAIGGDLMLAASGTEQRPPFPSVVYQRSTTCSAAGMLLAAATNAPLILEYNSGPLHNGSTPALGRYEAWIERINLHRASRIVVVSSTLREQLVQMGVPGERILVNPNGVDTSRFQAAPDIKRTRERWGIPPHAVVFGFVGSFGFWHGAPVLAEAFVDIASRQPAAQLLLVGDGDELAVTEDIVAKAGYRDRLTSLGRVDGDHVPDLLQSCDVLCSPHVPWPGGLPFHGSPTKLFEYMAAGRAIVASSLGQISEVLRDGETGLLVPPGDVAALSRAMTCLADDEELRQRLGVAARQRAESTHTWEAHARRVVAAATDESDR